MAESPHKTRNVGHLRKEVVIQSKTETRDALGGITETWEDNTTVWAEVEPLSGSETLSAGQVKAHVTHRIRMRYDERLTTTRRILMAEGGSTRTFHVIPPLNIEERGNRMTAMASELIAGV